MFVEKIAGQECETAARFYRPMMLDLNIFPGLKKKWRMACTPRSGRLLCVARRKFVGQKAADVMSRP